VVESSARQCRACGARLARDNAATICAACERHAAAATSEPPEMPPDYWKSDVFADAFASRHIGRVIRAYRHHPRHYRPLPQQLVGGWLGLTQAQLSRIENGPRVTDLTRLTAWAKTLGMPAAHLWFAAPGQAIIAPTHRDHAPDRSTTLRTRGTVKVGTPAGYGGSDDVRRSEFLAVTGGALVGLLAPPLVHAWRSEPSVPMPDLDEELLVQLRVQTEGFRWRDRQEGARQLLPHTNRYANRVTQFWQTTAEDHPLRPPLGQLAADACHLAAYQAFDQGDRSQATAWYRSSAELAARSRDQGMYVFAMCGVSYMYAREGRDDLAFNVLMQLAHLRLSATDGCYVAAYEAHAHAAAGSRDGARRALDRAYGLAGKAPDGAPSPWLGVPDHTWVDRQSASVLAGLGDPDVFELLAHLDANTPDVFQRYKVTLKAILGLACAISGEVERAAASLAEATIKNEHARSIEKSHITHDARRLLPSAPKCVQEFDELTRR
jgi:hypothetical protein